MIYLTLILILINQNLVNSCSFFETKKICECGVIYSKGFENQTQLFELPNLIKCGSNLQCNDFDCAEECLKYARKTLGDAEYEVSLKAKNKICELIAKKNESIFRNGIKLWTSWKLSGCDEGNELIVQDLCCNRQCKCGIQSQRVSNVEIFKNVIDLSDQLPIKDISYDCSISELEDCQTDCMSLISGYFNEQSIKYPNSSILNYNIFYQDFASDKICQVLNTTIAKPGIDIYASFDASAANFSIKYIALGRVCCKPICNCEYIFKDALKGTEVKPNEQIIKTTELNLAYECSDEQSNCMSFCRKQAFIILQSSAIFDPLLPVGDLQPLTISDVYVARFCDLINVPNIVHGYNVYLRYMTTDVNLNDSFPLIEDIHLGRFCCEFIINSTEFSAVVDCSDLVITP